MTADLRATILVACDEIAADLVDLRAIVQADRLLTDDETLRAVHLLDGMQRESRRAWAATFRQWAEIHREAASKTAGGQS